jgi:hypothetical protein
MSPKKRILTELKSALERSPDAPHVRPPALPGYAEQPERFQSAVNELLRTRLVEGRKDAAGHMIIAINQHRRPDVERMLRPVWARPIVWATAAALLVVGAGLVVV